MLTIHNVPYVLKHIRHVFENALQRRQPRTISPRTRYAATGFPLYHGTFFWAGSGACGLAPTRVKSSIRIRLPCVDGLLRANAGVDSLAQRLRQKIARDDERAGEDAQHHQKIVVLIPGALVAQRAEPGVGEDALDNVCPAQHMRHGDRHD